MSKRYQQKHNERWLKGGKSTARLRDALETTVPLIPQQDPSVASSGSDGTNGSFHPRHLTNNNGESHNNCKNQQQGKTITNNRSRGGSSTVNPIIFPIIAVGVLIMLFYNLDNFSADETAIHPGLLRNNDNKGLSNSVLVRFWCHKKKAFWCVLRNSVYAHYAFIYLTNKPNRCGYFQCETTCF